MRLLQNWNQLATFRNTAAYGIRHRLHRTVFIRSVLVFVFMSILKGKENKKLILSKNMSCEKGTVKTECIFMSSWFLFKYWAIWIWFGKLLIGQNRTISVYTPFQLTFQLGIWASEFTGVVRSCCIHFLSAYHWFWRRAACDRVSRFLMLFSQWLPVTKLRKNFV